MNANLYTNAQNCYVTIEINLSWQHNFMPLVYIYDSLQL